MKIAIQAADLDHDRIDGTRVYILNMLRRFGKISPEDDFFIYHRRNFNPELKPPEFPNYKIKKVGALFFWTQSRFAAEVLMGKHDVLWMPMHNLPILAMTQARTTVTIHDLAFKLFPGHFPKKDLYKINLLTELAVKFSDKIITVSESSKKDLLKFYPGVREEKIRVVHHGFDRELYLVGRDVEKENEVKKKLNINGDYILYAGAIQPRKNLGTLVKAYELFRQQKGGNVKLVLAGEEAWLSGDIIKKAQSSSYKGDIIMPGKLKFCDLGHLLRGARVYVFPSLYEGFGITILEAMASGVPVVCARNSSLPEVGGEAPQYFEGENAEELAVKIKEVLTDENSRNAMVSRGREQIKKFSWDKCARETLEWIKK